MKIIIAPGAFKHSLSARAAAEAIERGLVKSGLGAEFRLLPIADGGNGTLDAFLAGGGERIETEALDPLGRRIRAAFGLLPDGETAVIEMALASGLELVRRDELNAIKASTYGTGILMQAALDAGARRVIVGIGGSATTDGGAGCLQALGVRLLDADMNLLPTGADALAQVRQVDFSGLDSRWQQVEVIVAADVENPAVGPNGTAAVYGPQKGANPAEVDFLDRVLTHFFGVIAAQTGKDVRDVPGGGAAGALAAGLMTCLPARIQSGADLTLDYNGFDAAVSTADLVITGEGRMDSQTLSGKGPIGAARRAKQLGVPTVALVGGLQIDDALLHEAGLQAVLPIIPGPMPLDEALQRAAELLEMAARRLGYLLQLQK
jgi:glycerate 2-kinase